MIGDIFSGLFSVAVALVAAFVTYVWLVPMGARFLEWNLNPTIHVSLVVAVFGATVTKFNK